MHKKSTYLAFGALLIAFATGGQCADKSLLKQQQQQKQMQMDFISDARNTLTLCNVKYGEFVEAERMNKYLWQTEYNLNQSKKRLAEQDGVYEDIPMPKLTETLKYHVLCIEKSKGMLIPRSKGFIASFKASRQKTDARTLVAQWITTIDSVGKSVGQSEAAKFETLANGMLLDLQ